MRQWWLTHLVLATLAALVAAATGHAQDLGGTGPLALPDVVEYARAHNPGLAASRHEAEAAHAVPPQAAAWDDPVFAAESWNSPRAVPFDDAENSILKLTQRIPFPGKLALKGRMAGRDADIADAEARLAELEIVEAVKGAYWDLWLADRRLAVYERDLDLARELSSGTTVRYAAGTGTQPDVLRAEVERSHVATRLSTARFAREATAARLNELLSRAPDAPLGSPRDPGEPHVPGPLDRLIALARSNRPDLAARQAAIGRETDNVALARRGYLPDFELTFERFYNLDRRDGYGAVVGMTLPLPFKYRRDAAVDEARARLAAAEATRRRADDRAATAVAVAHAEARSAAAELELLAATHIPHAEQAFAASRAAYGAGTIDFTAFVDSLRMIESTHIQHLEAAAGFEKAYAALETAVGAELPRTEAP
jgi:outer membrane protein, heavy metal efflux system